MSLCPFAVHKLIPPGDSDPRIRPRVAILHVDAGGAASLFDYFRAHSGGVESHFHIRWDGTIEQYRDTDFQADANHLANDFAISIETQGFGNGRWNKRQLRSIKKLLLWLHEVHPDIPLKECLAPFGEGVGYHTKFGAPSDWTPVAKSCPGPNRIVQYEQELLPWMATLGTAPKPKKQFSVITANLWRDNRHVEEDLALLTATKAHVIGINEGADFVEEIAAVEGYQVFYGTELDKRVTRNNPILVRDDIVVHGQGHLQINDEVGDSPARSAKYVKFEFAGEKRAVVNLHANAGVQEGPARPRRLPRVREYIKSMVAVTNLVKGLEAEGYKVVVLGDLNWSWTRRAAQWTWAPKVVFGRIGYLAQFEHSTAPARPKGSRRAIEYVLYRPDDLAVWSQNFVEGEHSDHPHHQVTFSLIGV
jgi:endonuclease/exonuclease/phosphatase (EEP) superfamily protein YafD